MKRMSLNFKFLLIVGGLSLACVVISAIGLIGLSTVSQNLEYVVNGVSMEKYLWEDMQAHQFALSAYEQDLVNERDPTQRKLSNDRLDAEKKGIEVSIEKLSSKLATDMKKSALAGFKVAFREWWANNRVVREASEKGDRDAAIASSLKGRVTRDQAIKTTADMVVVAEMELASALKSIDEHHRDLRSSMIIFVLLSVGVGLCTSIALFRQIRKSIDSVAQDLTANSAEVSAASAQVAQSSGRLSQATIEQAASLQQTASSAQQLASMVQRNMENAEKTTKATEASRVSAEKGKRVVTEMTDAIAEIEKSNNDIMDQVNDGNRQISEITKVIAEISLKTRVINDIVFQTKLLSFNASVEAARAGEHGRGFAVVAEEVGNLARMSGEAAKDIGEMLGSSLQKVDSIVKNTKRKVEEFVLIGRDKVEAGNSIAKECAVVLDEIVSGVSEVTRMSADITIASREQAQGVQEISRAVTQLDFVTQSNSTAAEQASRAADHLSEQAQLLKSSVAELLIVVNGKNGEANFTAENSEKAFKKSSGSGSGSGSSGSGSGNSGNLNPSAKSAPPVAQPQLRVVVPPGKTAKSGAGKSGFKTNLGAALEKIGVTSAKRKSPTLANRTSEAGKAVAPSLNSKEIKSGRANGFSTPKSQGIGGKPLPGAKGQSTGLKLAAGSEIEIPAENDPRFKDV